MRPGFTSGWIVCLSLCGFLTSCNKGPDASTPTKAAVAFAKAAEAGDMDTVRTVATGTDAEFAFVKEYGQEMQAMSRFLAAGKEKFGDLGKSKNISLDLVADFENSDEKIDGDSATLTPKDIADAQPTVLKKVGSRWKVDLSYLDKDESARQQSEKIPQAAKAWDDAAGEIPLGVYRSFPEALGTARRKVDRIVRGAIAVKEEKEADDLKKARDDIKYYSNGLEAYKQDVGEYPSTLDGLHALIKQPSSAASWKGPYLENGITLDPWTHPYVYLNPGRHNANAFDLHSIGPDGQDETPDDITNWTVVP